MPHVIAKPSNFPLSQNFYTFGEAMEQVAAVDGRTYASANRERARFAVLSAIRFWDIRASWQFMQQAASSTSLVSGTATYNLPTDFRHPMSVKIGGDNARPLQPIMQKELDHWLYEDQSDRSGVPEWYILQGARGTGLITLYPTPNITGTLEMLYVRSMTEPVRDTEIIDVPMKVFYGVIAKGRELYLAEKSTTTTQLQYWAQEAERWFKEARADDAHRHPDQQLGVRVSGRPDAYDERMFQIMERW